MLLAAFAMVFVLARHFAIPQSFGEYGHYRAGSVAEYVEQELVHGAPNACAECHDEESELHADGKHAAVSCEVCHGPLYPHVTNGEVIAPMPVNRTARWCAVCHQQLVARPQTFPQVVIPGHVIERNAEMSDSVCLECHDAHQPIE